MDSFAEMAPAAGLDPMPPRPRPRLIAPTAAATTPTGWTRPVDSTPSRVSIDPMQATDRYRLVMPYDQRL